MKKSAVLMLSAIIFALIFSSCSATSKVKVNGSKIDNEVYAYFESAHDGSLDGDELESAVKFDITRYVTVNSEFANRSLTLSVPQKAELSETVNDLWHLYGSYYEDKGISKQTVYKIEQSKQYEKSLLADYYGESGVSPVGEDEIKAFFSENYAAIRFVTGYLFNIDDNGTAVDMTDEQRLNTIEAFNSVASMVNNETKIEEAVGSLGSNVEVHDSIINAFTDGSFPTGFFEQVQKIDTGKASAVVLGNYVFLVLREDVFSETYGYYSTYRGECLERMKGKEFSAIVDEWAKNYIAE
ncbi:MAG: hypothetical protein J1F23_06120 [Oscillospiraceae bacterium]|nr:hypothetical protein [Oscillospiraceae bacterium]